MAFRRRIPVRLIPGLVLAATIGLLTQSLRAAEQETDPPTSQQDEASFQNVVPVYDGGALYAANCANCHGAFGEGDGIVTPSLSVVLLDLRYLAERNDGVFPQAFIHEVIDGRAMRAAHGPEDMPIWGAEFARSEGYDAAADARVSAKIDALIAYLASIQISGSD
jgi:mono/diheme cytochrome c family protein